MFGGIGGKFASGALLPGFLEIGSKKKGGSFRGPLVGKGICGFRLRFDKWLRLADC